MTDPQTIISPAWSNVFYFAFIVLFVYFLLLMCYYLLLAMLGLSEQKKRTLEIDNEMYSLLSSSTFTFPVSVVIPARNEEEWIADSLESVLRLNYPEFEVIVVDDGSTDKTPQILNDMLALKSYDRTYVPYYRDGKVREIFKSEKYPHVTVISKSGGHKKAGAVNAGLNLAKHEYICVIDADTVLEPDALLKVMAHIQRDPERIIGIGSYFGLSNGFNIKDGKIIERSFSYKPLIAYQNLEYIRSFIGNRIAWSKFNAMPNVAGGFGFWRRDVVYKLGGYDTDFTCEDIELTFRAHDYIAKNRQKGYKILMLPYFVGWTEGPSNVKSLVLQRNRWQRVIEETMWKYRYMLFNPRFGALGFLVIPYYILYEIFGSFFEVVSIGLVALGWFWGVLDLRAFLAITAFMILVQGLISSLCVLAALTGQKLLGLRYAFYLVLLSFLEFFWYRWLISFSRISGTISYVRKIKDYTMYQREKRAKK